MATKTEKSLTPPLISHVSLTSFLNQIRDMGTVPSRIDKTLMPKASGSQSAGTIAALRYLGLIDVNGKPTEQFKSLVLAQDEDRKAVMAQIITKSYGFLFDDEEFDLQEASSGEMIDKFRALEISGSTLTKTIAFFLAAAKEYGIAVSPHIKAPPAPKGNGATRKPSKGKEEVKRNDDEPEDDDPEAVERFEIPIPGKSSVKVIVPNDLDADDWEMLQHMITVYIKRWKNFKDKGDAQ
ncbi:MAG: hypothetical protein GC139_08295 [Sideroxydans sp.]|nr:hypothetical protein [Sideroxydans sp.]